MLTSLLLATAIASTKVVDEGYPPYVTAKTLYADNDLRGKKLPKIEVETWLTGAPDLKDKIILLDMWATWCGPCRALIPETNKWQEKYKKDLVVIGLSDEPVETIKKFMEGTKMNYSVATDTSRKTSTLIGVKGIPHVLIITPDHVVRWQGFPGSAEDKLTEEKIEAIIKTYRNSQK